MIDRLIDRHPFLGLNRLMQPLAPVTIGHRSARELVYNDDLVLHHHVVLVAAEAVVGLQRLFDVFVQLVHRMAVLTGRRVGEAHPLLAGVSQLQLVLLHVEGKVVAEFHLHGDRVRPLEDDALVRRGGACRLADDERRARLIDEDAIGLVHKGEVVRPLGGVIQRGLGAAGHPRRPERRFRPFGAGNLEAVAQEVEPELAGRAVGDVAAVGRGALRVGHLHLDGARCQAERFVDGTQQVAVALGQVVVDRGDVDTLALQRVEEDGQCGGERLALAGGQLGQAALV